MAKHRKTRKEKLRSDNRQQHVIVTSSESLPIQSQQEDTPFQFTFSATKQETSPSNPQSSIKTNNYAFVGHDLRKTGFVTGGITVAELLFYMFMR